MAMSLDRAPVDGGEEMIILCEKVLKADVQVRFFEQDHTGRVVWEGFGEFGIKNVHKQVCKQTPLFLEIGGKGDKVAIV